MVLRYLPIVFSCLVIPTTFANQAGAAQEVQKQSIQATVVEVKSGQPIRKVNVEVMGGEGQSYGRYSATTSTDGTFTIEGLKPGRYKVILERTGFVQTATSRGQATFTLQQGQSLTGLVFKMQAAGLISGKIVDVDGDPMPHVSVQAVAAGAVVRVGLRVVSSSGETNDLGEYRIVDLRPGKYLISAVPSQRMPTAVRVAENGKEKEQLIYVATYYPGTLDKGQAIALEVRAGGEAVANFSVLMTRTYRVSGTIAGAPGGKIVQLILDANGGSPSELKEGNRFEFQNVPPGVYEATLVVVGDLSSGGAPDVQMLQLNPSITVDKGDVEGLQLQAEQGGQIRGVFRQDTGGKLEWTQLSVSLMPIAENGLEMSSEMGMLRMASVARTRPTVNSDGSFELKNVPGGNYQLVIGAHSDSWRDYYTKAVIFGSRDVADSGFGVNGDVYLDVVISAKGATIEGDVVDSKGQPVAYSTVAIVPNLDHRARPDSYQQQQTNEHGHFVARGLTPGSYVVLAFEEFEEDLHQPDFLKTHLGKGQKIEVDEGARKSVTATIISAESDAP